MFSSYKDVLGKYAQFSGRSRRLEYWGFVVINAIIVTILAILLATVGMDADAGTYTAIGWVLVAVLVVYGLFVLIPSLALQWRRYQDIGWAGAVSIVGWFVPLLTLIVSFIPGNPGENQYGPDPKA